VDVHTAHVACRLTKLVSRTPKGSKEVLQSPGELLAGDKATVELTPLRPLCVELYSEYPSLGAFAMRDMRTTVAVGQVLAVERGPGGGGAAGGAADGEAASADGAAASADGAAGADEAAGEAAAQPGPSSSDVAPA
jgi:hypothetical protein